MNITDAERDALRGALQFEDGVATYDRFSTFCTTDHATWELWRSMDDKGLLKEYGDGIGLTEIRYYIPWKTCLAVLEDGELVDTDFFEGAIGTKWAAPR